MSEIILTKDNFQKEVFESSKPVVVEFWAPWCGPCRMFAPVLSEFAAEYAETFVVGKVNVEEEIELSLKHGVKSVPTIKVFKNGKIMASETGFMSKEELIQLTSNL